ncbi:uncharacterized protein LOC122014653 isoform X1 [Zingiber officinale]|uniref:C3H1-type domain-containing protein n=1 Tax=Zingiber officinale TaxID=94328 RepID=A0A8J5FA21_ZINOF|nr:uncharacterized protein LOC122014653 isoform X1 [Zingiber officinale]XP_042426917.1 uncharacterized protein LOC122014653 isoform X1 [Zingiber officinale]KAG6483010.1 hypothetical protein ZIOFF_059650 [Zingiber officinale]
MDPLDSPRLVARSRYDPHPPPPHHLVDPNYYSHQSHHHHHHHVSFPSSTPSPQPYPSHHARSLRHEHETRLPVVDGGGGGGGRLRVPYQIDPFSQLPLRFPDRSPLPEDRYPSLRPHLMGHGENFVRDSPESRVFNDDRFRVVVDESQDLLRLRWEDEERRHHVACSRANLYRDELAVDLERRKRPRWLEDTDLEEHLGGPSKKHLRVWDKEIDHPHRILLPNPSTIPPCASSPRAPRDFVAIDGKREADHVAEWRYLLPPMKSYSDIDREDSTGERPLHMPFYSDRNRDIGRDREDTRELGPILERHLRSPFPTMRSHGNSYSHINRQFETTSDVYDAPTTRTVYSCEENYVGDNRGKRKPSNKENDQIIIWSPEKQIAMRPSATFFNRGKEQIIVSTSSKQPAKRPSALSRLQSGVSVWSRLQEKPLFHTSPSDLVSQPTTSVKHQLEVITPNFSLKSSSLVGDASSPRSALLNYDGKGQERSTPKRLVKKKLARKGEEFAIPVDSGSLVLEAKDGISKMLTLNTSQKKLDDPEASDNQGSSSIKDVNNASRQNSSRRAISTVTMDENKGQELMDEKVREEEETLHSVIGGSVKETNCIVEKQEIELATCVNLGSCQSKLVDTETAKQSVLTDPSRCDEEEKGKQFIEVGQTLDQNCANALLDIGDLNTGSSSPINHVSLEGKLDDETEQLSSALQAQNTIDENHDSQNFEGSDDNKKVGGLDKEFVTFSSEYSSSPLRKSEQLVMPVCHMTSSLTSHSIFGDNLKMKQHTIGNQHIEVDVDAKELKEISGGNSTMSDVYLCMEIQNHLVNFPPQLMDTASDGYLPDITTDEKDACLASHANVKSPQSDNLKPREEDLVDSSIFMCEVQDALPCVAPERLHSGLADRYGCSEDGLIKDICDQDQKVITEDKYLLAFRESLAPEVEGALNISCKPMFEKETDLLSDDTAKQKSMESKDVNGQEHLNQKTMPTVGLPKDTPIRANSVNCSKESTQSHLSLRHKTWHRKDAPSSISQVILRSQKGGSLSKLSPRKLGKIHNSYVRKGNSLIRKSASQPSQSLGSTRKLNKGITEKNIVYGSHGCANNILARSNPSFESKLSTEPTQPSQYLGSTSKLTKDIMEKSMNSRNNILYCPSTTFERPKTPPLPLAAKLSDSTFVYSSEAPHGLSENSVAEATTDVQDNPLILPSGGINDQNDTSDKICEPLGKSVIYVKHRSNQLVAASGHKVNDSVNSSLDKSPALISSASSDYYYRKNKNQLIRNVYSSEGQSNVVLLPGNGNMSGQKVSVSTVNGVTSTLPKKKLNKAQDKRHKYSSFSHVWTLSGKRPSKKSISSLPRIKVLPYLFPWKRATLLQSLKMQFAKKKDTLYTQRTDGFFLKKSGVSRLGRSSLKWSRSMQRRSKVVNKEAELAVAEVEKKNREQNNLFSISGLKHSINSVLNEQSCANDQGIRNYSVSSVPQKLLGGNNERYIRIGNGNQLVRDPKKLTRILASEKVRWSLHTARLRLAKKNQYCQFFTRFGKCNKKGGKCPYIHDPSKVAICTKFLNGSCSNMDCKLAHKIIPERMPDCSYFLQGLCTNTSCSYRHVNVNPNASVCEGFLKGYCVDGDECCKKHSYVCPIYQATGKCLQGSKCKLHHPKTKNKTKKRKDTVVQGNTWGRYFGSDISLVGEPLVVSLDKKVVKKANDLFCNGQFTEFIALAADEIDDEASFMVSEDDTHPSHFESGNDALQNNDLDALIKPIRIMRKDYPPLPASTNGS